MLIMQRMSLCVFAALALASLACAQVNRPWVGAVFFYWYTWDRNADWGGWQGGVHYTPLVGYYDSRTYADNLRSLHQAADWGVTHFFMDYWAPDWKADTGEPRDLVLMRATEELRRRGYNVWMSYYQDGENFAMSDFARNITERRDVYNWLKNYAGSEAWPRLQGSPFQMVYARNGAPQIMGDSAGFRQFLRGKYGSLEALNRAWGSRHQSFEDIEFDLAGIGPQRADAADYQYSLWQKDWEAMNQAVSRELGYPGVRASLDVGYTPFRALSYSDFARVFGGPHSYAGIFGQPHEQDSERFIQSAVAKRYGSIFFDHLKNNYCDWNTEGRVPGTEYPADPLHFDRFWVGNLMRYCSGVLHMSWNEWWEGSNMEPSLELGKQFCERNLLYSTLMQHAFPSMRDFGKGARIGLLLNDWAFKCGADAASEVNYCVEALRRSMVPFSIIPDEFVTAQELSQYRLVIAPAAQMGFGRNAAGEDIASLLAEWARGGGRLLVSRCAEFERILGLKRIRTAKPGGDLSRYVDVGAPGDGGYLLAGASHREDWDKLPGDTYGRTDRPLTVRWTPATGKTTRLLLPASPNRAHTLRFAGNAIWPNTATLFAEGQQVGSVTIKQGYASYEVAIPADVVGSRRALHVDIVYEQAHVPKQRDPQRFPAEERVCNLALDWVQICTAGMPFSEAREGLVRPRVLLADPVFGSLKGKVVQARRRMEEPLDAGGHRVLSRYQEDKTPHALLAGLGRGQVLFTDTPLGEVQADYLRPLLRHWATEQGEASVEGREVMGALLKAGDTRLLLAYNRDIRSKRSVRFSVDVGEHPVAEVTALSADGLAHRSVRHTKRAGRVTFGDSLRYYGVYQVAVSPVKLKSAPVAVCVGNSAAWPLELRNITAKSVKGRLVLDCVIPTLRAEEVPFSLRPGERVRVMMTVSARDDADPGAKTVALRVVTDSGFDTYFWRQVLVQRPPDLRVQAGVWRDDRLRLAVRNDKAVSEPTASAARVIATLDDAEFEFGNIAPGCSVERSLPLRLQADRPTLLDRAVTVAHSMAEGERRAVAEHRAAIAACPRSVAGPADARAAVCVFRTLKEGAWPAAVVVRDLSVGDARGLALYTEAGKPVQFQRTADGGICFAAPPGPPEALTYFLRRTKGPAVPTDLKVRCVNLGTGHGVLELSNEYLSLRFREQAGAVCTKLALNRTGQQYAADCFGAAYGDFSRSDPLRPAHRADEYIREEKVEQATSPGRLRLIERGPVRAVWEAVWEDDNVAALQRYELWAGMPWLKVTSTVRPKKRLSAQELVLLDLRVRREHFTKIYPGFSGQMLDQQKPHFGWRQVLYVHEVGSMLAPLSFQNSLSLVVADYRGLNGWRQGFWPERRPQPGPCKYARIELLRTKPGSSGASAECYILAHDGNQKEARRFLDEIKRPPIAVAVPVRP